MPTLRGDRSIPSNIFAWASMAAWVAAAHSSKSAWYFDSRYGL